AEPLAFGDVAADGLRVLGEHALDEPAGRDQHLMAVAELDQLADPLAWHEHEGAARQLETVDVRPHRLEDVFQVPPAHRCVVGAADLCDAARARLPLALVHPDEWKRSLGHLVSSVPALARRLVSSLTGIASNVDT